jgi:hypothetical protein
MTSKDSNDVHCVPLKLLSTTGFTTEVERSLSLTSPLLKKKKNQRKVLAYHLCNTDAFTEE